MLIKDRLKYVVVLSIVFVYLIGDNQTNAGKSIRKAYLIENELFVSVAIKKKKKIIIIKQKREKVF